LDHFINSDAGGGERSFPILIVRTGAAIEIELKVSAVPKALRETFEIERAAGLIGRTVRVVELLNALINCYGRVCPNFELRIAHVESEVRRVVGYMPCVRQHA